jgi:hypothetical protein
MSTIDLPRAVEAYFSFAELPANRHGRHFTITFTYFEGTRLDRLQWWWQIGAAQERSGGQGALQALRLEAIERFRTHIERWLINSQRCLKGGDPFPMLEADVAPTAVSAQEPVETAPGQVLKWPGRVANG